MCLKHLAQRLDLYASENRSWNDGTMIAGEAWLAMTPALIPV